VISKHAMRLRIQEDSLITGFSITTPFVRADDYHNVAWALWTSVFGRRKARLGIVRYAKEDVLALERLLAAGEYRPVIDRTYRLEDVVEAHRYVETRQKTGNVVLSLNGGPR